jgi:hypothetical protein
MKRIIPKYTIYAPAASRGDTHIYSTGGGRGCILKKTLKKFAQN